MKQTHNGLSAIRLPKGFWQSKTKLVAEVMLPYQWQALNDQIPGAVPSHAVENFRIASGEQQGEFAGNIWQDSDVAKWLEAACHSLANYPDSLLASQVEEAIRLIGKAQQADGYINTWFTTKAPEKRWTDLVWSHELYSGGHLMEAAVTHFYTTGRTDFLDIMRCYADCLIPVFGPGGKHGQECCGHPEIELALMRLSEATGDRRYFDLAVLFMEVRGTDPGQFIGKKPLDFVIPETVWFGPDYFQAHQPLAEQRDADGHAVRAVYLYTALTQQYRRTRDPDLKTILDGLWDSATGRRMYLTAGIGSQAHAERFTVDWDLPGDTAYNETCATIGLIFWAWQLLLAEPDRRYSDIIERGLYNGALSGMSLDGTRFFYVNPLESVPRIACARHDHEHVKTSRVAWLGCACCPPNIARQVASVGDLSCHADDKGIWVHQYLDSQAELVLAGQGLGLRQETDYPWDGRVKLTLNPTKASHFSLHLRIPGWCADWTCRVNGQPVADRNLVKGYLDLERDWQPGDTVELDLPMNARFISPNSRVSELAGKVAVMRGPLVYCAEELDNGGDLHNLLVDPARPISSKALPEQADGGVVLYLSGFRETSHSNELYGDWQSMATAEAARITLFPYYQWGNRRPGQEMRVWLRTVGSGRQ